MILLRYVDELFLIVNEELIIDARRILATEFEMKYLGMMHYLLAMEVWQSVYGMFLGKGKYTMDILNRFRMLDYKAMTTPMASIGKP